MNAKAGAGSEAASRFVWMRAPSGDVPCLRIPLLGGRDRGLRPAPSYGQRRADGGVRATGTAYDNSKRPGGNGGPPVQSPISAWSVGAWPSRSGASPARCSVSFTTSIITVG